MKSDAEVEVVDAAGASRIPTGDGYPFVVLKEPVVLGKAVLL